MLYYDSIDVIKIFLKKITVKVLDSAAVPHIHMRKASIYNTSNNKNRYIITIKTNINLKSRLRIP